MWDEGAAEPGIPNPFVTSNPLTPDQPRMLFRGREPQIREIESLLADPRQSASIALLAPRRCGKTSLLQMLPVMLPDAICVFFDPQDNSLQSIRTFFCDLAKQARNQCDRRLAIPALPELEDPIDAGRAWFEAIEKAAGDHRVLIAIDEFERMEELFGGDKRDFLRLMGLFRATIQHRKKLRLLVAGAAPFDELGSLWDDHFINTREIRMGLLGREDSVSLLRKPVEEFPDDAIPLEVAEEMYRRTGGQPYLLQMHGSVLVALLNEQKRTVATIDDIPAVEQKVITQSAAYFRDTIRRAPDDAKAALEGLARGERPIIPAPARRWLERRCLLTPEGTLLIPIFGEYIRQEVLA